MARPTAEIFDIFRDYHRTLYQQETDAQRSIDDWYNGIIKEISNHASEQRRLVREAYKIHEKHLNNIRDQVLEINSICWKKNDTTEIDELLEKCKNMKVELATISFTSRNSEFINVAVVEPPEQMYPQQYSSPKTTDKNSKIQLMSNNDYASGYNTYSSTGVTSFTPSHQPSTTTTSIYSPTQSTDNTENWTLRSNATGTGKLIEKCPICFMIFPSTMSEAGRTMHVNEHLSND